MLRHWINEAVASDDLREVNMLSIDEISFKPGHGYVTVVVGA